MTKKGLPIPIRRFAPAKIEFEDHEAIDGYASLETTYELRDGRALKWGRFWAIGEPKIHQPNERASIKFESGVTYQVVITAWRQNLQLGPYPEASLEAEFLESSHYSGQAM